jgi:hypothetical protein
MYDDASRAFFEKYEWIHTTLGILGNVLFFVGSIMFLYEALKRLGVWLFIVGSFLMLVGAVGDAVVKWVRNCDSSRAREAPIRVLFVPASPRFG